MYGFQSKWIKLSKDEEKKDKGWTCQKNKTELTDKSSEKMTSFLIKQFRPPQ